MNGILVLVHDGPTSGKRKKPLEWKKPKAVIEYRPKVILDKPNIYINEDGGYINIEMPELTITIKKKK